MADCENDDCRSQMADELEAAGSPLCDCEAYDSPPTSPNDRSRHLAHHCDCAAVTASRIIRRGATPTRHDQECSH